MKKLILIFIPLALTACGGQMESRPNPHVALAGQELRHDLISESFRHPEQTLVDETYRRIATKQWLGATGAEQCWNREEKRERIRFHCLLIWAPSAETSALLSEALAKHSQNPIVALAAVLERTTLRSWTFDKLVQLLETLREQPTWLRGRAALAWLPEKSLSPMQADTLAGLMGGAESPADFSELWELLGRIRPGARERLLNEYCSPRAEGPTRLRCWRFLSAIPSDLVFLRFLPRLNDPDWIYFRRNMPHRARVLETR